MADGIEQWDWSAEPALRNIIQVGELYDVGPVTFPAYEETSIAMRSFQEARARREVAAYLIESEHHRARLRLLEVC
jgi:phage head maturation protease